MKLTTMINIGIEMNRKLNAVGIHSAEELSQLGSKETFFRLKTLFPEVRLVHLYTLQGAIDNVAYHLLSQEVKNDLKSFSDSLTW